MPGPLSCLFLFILRSYSRGLLVTCKVGHLPWEHREGDRAVLPSAQPLMATQHVLSTASIPPRRKSKCCTHHGLSFISLSAPSPSTWPLLTHNSHNGPPSGPETDRSVETILDTGPWVLKKKHNPSPGWTYGRAIRYWGKPHFLSHREYQRGESRRMCMNSPGTPAGTAQNQC